MLQVQTPLNTTNKTRKVLSKRADRAWSTVVKVNAGFKCEVCGSDCLLDPHHFVDRDVEILRHCTKNGVCLCRRCHNQAEECKDWFDRWMLKYRPQDYRFCKLQEKIIFKPTISYLRDIVEDLEKACQIREIDPAIEFR